MSILSQASLPVEKIEPRITRITRIGKQEWKAVCHPSKSAQIRSSDQMFAVVGAEPDGFVLQIVHRANEPHSFAFGAHQNGMGDRGRAF